MDYTGKTQFSLTIVSPAELEDEGDRICRSHAAWIEKTHHREGEKALLQYNIAKWTDDDGNIVYLLTEVYATPAGVQDHMQQAEDWEAYGDLNKWLGQCQVTGGGSAIIHSLW